MIAGETLIDLGNALEIPASWLPDDVTVEQVAAGLRPLLDKPVEFVLPTHGEPADRAAFEPRLSPDPRDYDAAATTSSATSVGVVPTLMPTASSASFFACAVPDEPLMIAPAWPIVFPGGAEKPAMYENTGFVMCSATYAAAFSSSSPPISPTSTIVLGLGIGFELLEDVDEARADDRVAADADDRRVAEPALRELVADLVGQRPRARHEADRARAGTPRPG